MLEKPNYLGLTKRELALLTIESDIKVVSLEPKGWQLEDCIVKWIDWALCQVKKILLLGKGSFNCAQSIHFTMEHQMLTNSSLSIASFYALSKLTNFNGFTITNKSSSRFSNNLLFNFILLFHEYIAHEMQPNFLKVLIIELV